MSNLPALAALLHCRRTNLDAAKKAEDLAESQLLAAMIAAGVDVVVFCGGWRARREQTVTRKVKYAEFVDACRELHFDESEVVAAGCIKRSIDLDAARKLLADLTDFDRLCDVKPRSPCIKIDPPGKESAQ